MIEARKLGQVLRNLNRRVYYARHPTIQQYPDSMDELSEDDETPTKKQKK